MGGHEQQTRYLCCRLRFGAHQNKIPKFLYAGRNRFNPRPYVPGSNRHIHVAIRKQRT